MLNLKIRNPILDLMKGIAICLVVLGHHENILTNYIYSFHMPLFFLLSGIVHKNEENLKYFVKKKIKNLLVPYFLYSISLFIIWFFIGKHYGMALKEEISTKSVLLGIIYSANLGERISLNVVGPLWFLPCLFIVEILFYFQFIFFKSLKKIIIFQIGIIILLQTLQLKINLPWHIDTAIITTIFYILGYFFKDRILLKTKNSKILWIGFFLIGIVLNNINGRIDMQSNFYGKSIFLFYITALINIYCFVKIVQSLKSNKIFESLGKNTLIILAFHNRGMSIIKFIGLILGKKIIEGYWIIDLLYSVFQILLCSILKIVFLNFKNYYLKIKYIIK